MSTTNSICIIFLMSELSAPRILNGILGAGIGVEPWVKDDQLLMKRPGAPSTVLCIRITHRSESRQDAYRIVRDLLGILEVPYYGMTVTEVTPEISLGNIPNLKIKKPLLVGPYRTQGTVIPFPTKEKDSDNNGE